MPEKNEKCGGIENCLTHAALTYQRFRRNDDDPDEEQSNQEVGVLAQVVSRSLERVGTLVALRDLVELEMNIDD